MYNIKQKYQVRFLENADGEGKIWRVVLIEAGHSLNNRYYSPEVLKKSVKLFENIKSFAYEFRGKRGEVFDHMPDSIRAISDKDFLRNVVGWFDNCEYQEFKVGGALHEGICANFNVVASWLREMLLESVKRGVNLVGFSLDAQGAVREGVADGRSTNIVQSIEQVDSVDLVSFPAAGGRIMRLVASIGELSEINEEEEIKMKQLGVSLKELATLVHSPLAESVKEEMSIVEGIELINKLLEDKESLKEAESTKSFLTAIKEMLEKGEVDGALGAIDKVLTGVVEGKKEDEEAKIAEEEKKKKEEEEAAKEEEMMMEAKNKKVKEAKEEKEKMETKEFDAKLQEATSKIMDTFNKKAEELTKKVTDAESKNTETSNLLKMKESEVLVSSLLSNSGLPELTVSRLTEQFKGRVVTKEEVEKVITSERDYLGKILEAQQSSSLVPLGGQKVEVGKEKNEKIKEGLLGFFSGEDVNKTPAFASLRKAYEAHSGRGGAKPREILQDSLPINPRVARMLRLSEALTSSSWAQVLGDSITRQMVAEYNREDWSDWKKIVSIVTGPADFRTNRRTRIGGYGTLPTVAEGGSYTALSSPGDEEATYAVAKKGGLETLTLEMIQDDDVGAIKRIPNALGRAAGLTLYRAVFDLLADNGTIYDSTALFTASHSNLVTAGALSDTTLSAARQAMMDQAEYGDSSAILGAVNVPKFILVPNELENLAYRLTTSPYFVNPATGYSGGGAMEAATTPNLHKGMEVILVSYWTDADDWYVITNPKNVPTIEVGFLDGQREPELFVQESESVGSMFDADKLTYKIRHCWGISVLDFRGFYGKRG